MLTVTFLGTSAARPTVERNVSGLAVRREGETLLFECGEGTQRQMMRYGVSFAFSEIFFTHFHADHFLGVIGLIRTLGLQGRPQPLVLYGPEGAQKRSQPRAAARRRGRAVPGRKRRSEGGRQRDAGRGGDGEGRVRHLRVSDGARRWGVARLRSERARATRPFRRGEGARTGNSRRAVMGEADKR